MSRSVSISLPENGAATWPWIGRSLAAAARFGQNAEQWAQQNGAPSQALRLLKAGVPAAITSEPSWAGDALGDSRSATVAFLASLQTKSVLARIIADNAVVRIPLNRRVAVTTADATGWVIDEGKPVPLSRLELSRGLITPVKAAALMAVSDEFLADVGAAAQTTFNNRLKDAVSKAIDAYFLGQLMDESDFAPISSSGPDASDALADLRAALNALQPSGDGLYWVANRKLAIMASCLGDSGGRTFPDMTPVGGSLLGLPFLVSNAVEDGELVLLDAGALAGDFGPEIAMRASGQADIEMRDDPTQDATTGSGASMVSMYQTNSVALLCIVSFGVEKLRSAIAVVEGVDWGSGATA